MEIIDKREGNIFTIGIIGELDTISSPILDDKLKTVPSDITELILDLDKLDYISSSGIREFIIAQKLMDEKEGTLKLKNINDFVSTVLTASGIIDMFNIE